MCGWKLALPECRLLWHSPHSPLLKKIKPPVNLARSVPALHHYATGGGRSGPVTASHEERIPDLEVNDRAIVTPGFDRITDGLER